MKRRPRGGVLLSVLGIIFILAAVWFVGRVYFNWDLAEQLGIVEPQEVRTTETADREIQEPDGPLGSIAVLVDGRRLELEQEPFREDGVLMIPMRQVFEAAGADISYDAKTGEIVASTPAQSFTLTPGQDPEAQLVDGTTFVNATLLEERLGLQVNWEPERNRLAVDSTVTPEQVQR